MITTNLLNKKYEISDHSKANHTSYPKPSLYFSINPFIIGNPGLSNLEAEGPQNENPYKPKKTEQNKSKFKAVFIIGGNKHESTNERK